MKCVTGGSTSAIVAEASYACDRKSILVSFFFPRHQCRVPRGVQTFCMNSRLDKRD